MATARSRAEWDRTSTVLAMLYNSNRKPDSRAATADDFMPAVFRQRVAPRAALPSQTADDVRMDCRMIGLALCGAEAKIETVRPILADKKD